jgi:nicotinamidase-related amidase
MAAPLELDPRSVALVLIDLMPRIIERDLAPYSGGEVLQRCSALAVATRAAGGLVVPVRVERPGVDAQPEGSGFAVDPSPEDLQIVKRTIGAFHETGLDAALRDRGIDTIALAGIATNFGVESTGRAADEHGFRVIYITDAMTGLDAHAHEFAVGYVFPRFGEVATAAGFTAALAG